MKILSYGHINTNPYVVMFIYAPFKTTTQSGTYKLQKTPLKNSKSSPNITCENSGFRLQKTKTTASFFGTK